MTLPSFFIADLPPEASVSATTITEACQTLKRNRGRHLAERSTESIIRTLADVAKSWRDPDFRFRKMAFEMAPTVTGFSEPVLRSGLDDFFSQLTEHQLRALVLQELGHEHRLDKFSATELEHASRRTSIAHGPELLVHIAGGVLPNPTFTSVILGWLARSAQFVKCASGTSLLLRLFAHSIYEADPKLGACLEIAEWKGGHAELEAALFAECDCVTAMGTDETLAKIRAKVPSKVRFIGYGHRVSFGYIASDALTSAGARQITDAAADDVIAWNQLGCLSPHVFYVENGGHVSPEHFAEMLARELERREQSHPRGELKHEEAAAIAYRRSFYEVRAASCTETRLWTSKDSTAWTVLYENDAKFQLSCLNRFIYVKSVANLEEALHGADAVCGQVSTVGLAATKAAADLARNLARWGVTRICPLGQMQNPPLTWRHDGRPALGDLITWTDWEQL